MVFVFSPYYIPVPTQVVFTAPHIKTKLYTKSFTIFAQIFPSFSSSDVTQNETSCLDGIWSKLGSRPQIISYSFKYKNATYVVQSKTPQSRAGLIHSLLNISKLYLKVYCIPALILNVIVHVYVVHSHI